MRGSDQVATRETRNYRAHIAAWRDEEMRFRFTHFFDAAYRAALVVAIPVTTAALFDLIAPLGRAISQVAWRTPYWEQLRAASATGFIMATLIGSWWLLRQTVLPPWLPTWLYLRLAAGAPATIYDAERSKFLFDGSIGSWYRVAEVARLPADRRLEAVYTLANRVAAERGFAIPFPGLGRQEEAKKPERPLAAGGVMQLHLSNLGLSEVPATFDGVKEAYRHKLRQYHPDLFARERPDVRQMAATMTLQLNASFDYLEREWRGAR
jgi:hypothetical protein